MKYLEQRKLTIAIENVQKNIEILSNIKLNGMKSKNIELK